jgi:hypothetical protein
LKVALHSKYYTVGGSALTVERINFVQKLKSENFLFQFSGKMIIKEPTVLIRELTKNWQLLWLGLFTFQLCENRDDCISEPVL